MQFQPNEVITLLLGLAVLLYFLMPERKDVLLLPHPFILLTSLILLVASWLATNLEEVFANEAFNLLQHALRAASQVAFLAWYLSLRRPRKETRR